MALLEKVQPGLKQAPGMLIPLMDATSHVSLPGQGAAHANKVMVQAAGMVASKPAARKVHSGPQVRLLPAAVL